MIIVRTPFRVSLFGGGTDFPVWFKQHGGRVIGGAINRYCYINIRSLPKFFSEYKHRIVYSKVELVGQHTDIEHPAVRAALDRFSFARNAGIEMTYSADLPANSGIGSSSSFVVGLLKGLHVLQDMYIGPISLAELAVNLEQVDMNEAVGCQDQYWAACGGFGSLAFNPDGSVDIENYPQGIAGWLEANCLMVFSGLTRYAFELEQKKICSIETDAAAQEAMHHLSYLTEHARSWFMSGPDLNDEALRHLAHLIEKGWFLKAGITPASPSDSALSMLYQEAKTAGAYGGKLLGAGGGGFLFLLVPERRRLGVMNRLWSLGFRVFFSPRLGAPGCKIIEEPGLELAKIGVL